MNEDPTFPFLEENENADMLLFVAVKINKTIYECKEKSHVD